MKGWLEVFFRDKLVHLFLKKKKLTLVVSLLANARLNGWKLVVHLLDAEFSILSNVLYWNHVLNG